MEFKEENITDLGRWGEAKAAGYLKEHGYLIAETNYRRKTGEIDIIAFDGPVLCFIEVKTRSRIDFGLPCEAVNSKKRIRLRRTAAYYIMENNMTGRECRIDIIEIIRNSKGVHCRHLENALT